MPILELFTVQRYAFTVNSQENMFENGRKCIFFGGSATIFKHFVPLTYWMSQGCFVLTISLNTVNKYRSNLHKKAGSDPISTLIAE